MSSPESPPQVTAFFDAFDWASDAGLTQASSGFVGQRTPEQSRYSVFYHIYAGRDRPSSYSVWLQDTSRQNRLFVTNSAGGAIRDFIQAGGFASQTVDIIGPKGLSEICVEVNNIVDCGFGKVSTGFLTNYLDDTLTKNEVGKEIKNAEC